MIKLLKVCLLLMVSSCFERATQGVPIADDATSGLIDDGDTPMIINPGDKNAIIPQPDSCGSVQDDDWQNQKPENRSTPYSVFLLTTLPDGRKGQCGASVIAPRWILSAGHCVTQPPEDDQQTKPADEARVDYVEIYVGSSNKEDLKAKGPNTQYRMSNCFTAHPKYKQGAYDFDASLIYLDEPLEFTDTVAPVCIPNKGSEYRGPGFVSGYGYPAQVTAPIAPGESANDEKKFAVRILDHDECAKEVQQSSLFTAKIHETHCCAWKKNRIDNLNSLDDDGRVCFGDSGGPLVYFDEEQKKLYQAGVVSSALLTCNSPQTPDIYTRPSHEDIFDFINEALTKDDGFDHC